MADDPYHGLREAAKRLWLDGYADDVLALLAERDRLAKERAEFRDRAMMAESYLARCREELREARAALAEDPAS